MDGDWADPLRGVFGPDEFVNASRAYEIEASVVVQAVADVDETRELLMLAAETPQIAGVVGWIDLTAADVEEKFLGQATDAVGADRAKAIVDTVWGLDRAKNLEPLLRLIA